MKNEIRDYLDPSRYALLDKDTGEEIPVTIFMDRTPQHWNMAFAKSLAAYLEISGSPATAVLAQLVRLKDGNNRIVTTIRELAEATGASTKTVNRLMKRLKEEGFIKQIRNGYYMMSPHVMRHGERNRGAMVLRLWDEIDALEHEVSTRFYEDEVKRAVG